MICRRCKQQHHDECRGGTRCDCQHREPIFVRGNEQIDRLARVLGLTLVQEVAAELEDMT